jgi:hypothetical protein
VQVKKSGEKRCSSSTVVIKFGRSSSFLGGKSSKDNPRVPLCKRSGLKKSLSFIELPAAPSESELGLL